MGPPASHSKINIGPKISLQINMLFRLAGQLWAACMHARTHTTHMPTQHYILYIKTFKKNTNPAFSVCQVLMLSSDCY